MKKLVALLLAVVMLFALVACGSNPSSNTPNGSDTPSSNTPSTPSGDGGQEIIATGDDLYEKKTPEGEVVFGTNQTIKDMNPTTAQDNSGLWLVYDRLWSLNAETGEYEPGLATSWEWLDSRTLSVTLRDDVYFHSGDKFVADDVLYTLERLTDPLLNTRSLMRWAMIDMEATEVVDDTHIIIRLGTDSGTLMAEFGASCGAIVNRSHCEAAGEEGFWDNVDGTGPFKLVQAITGDRQVYEINEKYWGEKPNFNKVTMRYYGEVATMFIDYENGDLDGCFGISAEDAQRVIDGTVDHTSLYIIPEHRLYYLAIAGYSEPLQDVRVRQALAYAMDREALASIGFDLLGLPGESLIAGGCNYGIPFEGYEYNPDKAIELLKEAGYYNNLTLRLTSNNQAGPSRMAEAFQAMLDAVGIKLEVGFFDTATHIKNVQGFEYDMSMNSITVDTLDPSQQWATAERNSGNQIADIRDEEINALLIAAKSTPDEAKRAELYAEFQKLVNERCWAVPIVNTCGAVILRDYFEPANITDPRTPNIPDLVLK